MLKGVARKGSSVTQPLEIIDSGDDSDGLSALRGVEAADAKTQSARRGPSNTSMQHYHDPVPVLDQRTGAKRWEFACRSCDKLASSNFNKVTSLLVLTVY